MTQMVEIWGLWCKAAGASCGYDMLPYRAKST